MIYKMVQIGHFIFKKVDGFLFAGMILMALGYFLSGYHSGSLNDPEIDTLGVYFVFIGALSVLVRGFYSVLRKFRDRFQV